MDFSTRKTIRGLGIVGIALLMIIGYLLVIQPFMAQSAKYSAEVKQVSGDRDTAVTKLTTLKTQQETIGDVEKHDDELSVKYPGSIDTPAFVSDLNSASSKSNTKLVKVAVSVPALETSAGGTDATAPVPAEGTATDASATSAPTDASAPGDVAAAPTPGAESNSSLASVNVEITAEGSINDLTQFTKELHRIDRNVTVNTVNISLEGENKDKATATYTATSYIYNSIPKVGDAQPEAETVPTDGSASTPAP